MSSAISLEENLRTLATLTHAFVENVERHLVPIAAAGDTLVAPMMSFERIYDRFASWSRDIEEQVDGGFWDRFVKDLLSVLLVTKDPELAAHTLGVLRCVARVDRNKRFIVRKNGVRVITSWMRSHSYASPDRLTYSMNMLSPFAITLHALVPLCFSSSVHNARVVSRASIALANLVMDSAHEAACVEHGGIDLALAAMRAHPTVVAVQTDAASLLCNLAFTSRYFFHVNCITFLAPLPVLIVISYCAFFSIVKINIWVRTISYTGQLLDDGALTLVMAAMSRYPHEAFLVEECCGCIRNLAGGSPANAVAVYRGGALPLVLAALDAHPDNTKLTEEALHSLV